MPRRRADSKPHVIQKVQAQHDTMTEAYKTYKAEQEAMLKALRWARNEGETLENLASSLDCSRQWIYKWTTYGANHNKIYPKAS